MSARAHLILFARIPQPGRVKTRLGRDIGAVAAGFWYRRTLRRLLHRLAGRTGGRGRTGLGNPWQAHLFVTPDPARRSRIWPRGWQVHGQGQGDLGMRMQRALAACGPGPVVLIGSDVPGIAPHHIRRAFSALGQADAVFGPATDGGFWLIGLRGRRRPPAFGATRWSTGHALDDTLAGFARGMRVVLVDQLADVDNAADLGPDLKTSPRPLPAGAA